MNRTQPPEMTAPPAHPGQLTAEDYENIWLRVKDRYWRLVAAALGITALLGGLGGLELAKLKLGDAVSSYTRTDDFRKDLKPLIAGHFPELDKRLTELEQREQKLSAALEQRLKDVERLSKSGLVIGTQNLVLTSAAGRVFRMDTGVLPEGINGDVRFRSPFSSKPLVFLSPIGGASRASVPITVEHVDVNGFRTLAQEAYAEIQWIAIGE